MKKSTVRMVRVVAFLLAFTLIAAACGDDEGETTTTAAGSTTTAAEATTTAAAGPIVVGDLAYYTGPFAPYGASLAADVDFPVQLVINLDPPLGRTLEVIHEDIGTVGEAQAARKLVEQDNVDILVSSAHQYLTYRDWLLGVIAEQDRPLMPTVHGGVIPANIGGSPTEPIFRAQGSDEGLGVTDALYAQSVGATKVVIFATQVAGFQLAADAAEKACAELGIEVLDRIDAQAEQASYRTEVQAIVDLNPDAVIVQAGSTESGTLIKQAAEAGLSLYWIGEVGWAQPEFIGTLTAAPIATQQAIVFPGMAPRTDNAAWDAYKALWDSHPEFNQYDPGERGAYGPYHFTTYDLMIITALAIEEAGSTKASEWAPAMFAVTDPPGTVCYTYPECIALIRAGTDIDYEGITGPGSFSEHGMNAVSPNVTRFNDDGTMGEQINLDPVLWLDLINKVAFQFEG
jgi:ABC-type branched-subunit amino acid transport system substrate-binding protein